MSPRKATYQTTTSRGKKKTCGGKGQFACKLPTSGSELLYDPVLWGSPVAIRNANCYAYSMGDYSTDRPIKSTPGAYAVLRGNTRYSKQLNSLSCPSLTKRVLADAPGHIYKTKAAAPCKQGYFKVMMFVTKRGAKRPDFHFFQNNKDVKYPVQPGDTLASIAHKFQVPPVNVMPMQNGFVFVKNANVWSQKHGTAGGAELLDSCNRIVFDPRKACRGAGTGLDYKVLCGSFCAARGKVRTV